MKNDIKLSPPKEALNDIQARTVVFRTYSIKDKAIVILPKEEVKRVLGILMYKLEYIGRGRQFNSVKVIFESPKMAKSVSTMSFKNEKSILLPTYMGKRFAKIKIENIPPMVHLEWVAEAVIFD